MNEKQEEEWEKELGEERSKEEKGGTGIRDKKKNGRRNCGRTGVGKKGDKRRKEEWEKELGEGMGKEEREEWE